MKSLPIVPLLSACLLLDCAPSEPSTTAGPKTVAEEPRPTPEVEPATVAASPASEPAAADTAPVETATSETAALGPELASPATRASTPTRTPDVIYVPTPQPVVDKMLEVAKVTKNDIVYDLGCGDGRIVVTAAKKYGTKAFGFDIDPDRVAEARANVRKNGVEELVTIEQKDIFTLDLSPASVVTLYLLPELNVRLIPQLDKLKRGSRVVSHDFDMVGVTPVKQLSVKPEAEARAHEVYLWTIPLKKTGGAK